MNWVAVVWAVVVAATTATLSPVALRHASHGPRELVDGERPPDYAALLSRRFIASVSGVSMAAGLVTSLLTPQSSWPAWLGLVGPLALAVCVDASTTWVPRLLSSLGAALTAAGIAVWAALDADPAIALRAAGGLLVTGLVFALCRAVSGGQLGMFDVRLAALVGAVTAGHSLDLAMAALLAGTAIGALWGVIHRLTRGAGAFAYGPPLWLGPFVALLAGVR